MDVITQLRQGSGHNSKPIQCVDMHTTGELTRIVVSGYPELEGALLDQRAQARAQYDHIRRRLMLEPRGHKDAYGAIIRPHTELTATGKAHVGVLFLTNDGYSNMCGHATIALGRFLVDTQDLQVFPKRAEVAIDMASLTARVHLHCPCGLIEITVPVTADGKKSDPTRQVSFVNVPAFTTGLNIDVDIAPEWRWSQLEGRTSVRADFAYGGAFFCFISAAELGFPEGLLGADLDAMNQALKLLRTATNTNAAHQKLSTHPDTPDLDSIYCFIVTDKNLGVPSVGADGAETGYCYFGDGQIDRSPTGSAVTAREALAYVRGDRKAGQKWTYHSVVSNAYKGQGGFDGSIVEVLDGKPGSDKCPAIRVRVSGHAFYIGTSTFVIEKSDILGEGGFLLEQL